MTWNDSYPPSSWKEWYSKDEAAKAASFIYNDTHYAGIYAKDGTTYQLRAQVAFTNRVGAEQYAALYIQNYDKAKAAQSTNPTSNKTAL